MYKISTLVLLAAWCGQSATAQPFDPVWAGKFQTALNNGVLTGPCRGATMSVFVPGQGMWTGVAGESSPGTAVTPDMRFGIASISKTFMAAHLLKLQEAGVLSLNDPLYQWLPPYPNVDSTVTIRQLLNHQSGIADLYQDNLTFYNDSIWADTSRVWTPQEVLATIQPAHFAPGKGYFYSNTNYILATLVIESATGLPWVQSLHNQVLDPLGLDSTFVSVLETPNGPVAHEWWNNNTTEIINTPMPSLYSMMAGPAGIFTTSDNLALFFRAMNDGTLLSQASLDEMKNFEPSVFYGLGLRITFFTDPFTYHEGQMISNVGLSVYDEKTGSVLSILINSGDLNAVFIPAVLTLLNEYPKTADDAGISAILTPAAHECQNPVNPSVRLKNFGTNPLTSCVIRYTIDNGPATSYTWTGNLTTGNTAVVSLPPFTGVNGAHGFEAWTSDPNGATEGYTWNDKTKSYFAVSQSALVTAPFAEGFEAPFFPPPSWVVGPESPLHWGRTTLTSSGGSSCAVRGNVNDLNSVGVAFDLDLPMISLNTVNNPALFFRHAYASAPGKNDSLRVLVSADCGATWQSVFYKGGNTLKTVPGSLILPFYPADSTQWRADTVSLAAFSGDVLIRFRCINRNGNNLFIDDVAVDQLTVGLYEATDAWGLNVYPNPVSDQLIIEVASVKPNTVLSVFNAEGNLIHETELTNTQTRMVTTTWPSGVYFVRVMNEWGVGIKRFVKL